MTQPSPDLPDNSGPPAGGHRALSKVLLKITLLLALVLGVLAALVQLSLDLQQQKVSVKESAEAFLDSITPSVTTAVYNFHDAGATQAIEGLFTQRAIRQVQIFNADQIMVEAERELRPTLPQIGILAGRDDVTLVRPLFDPEGDGTKQIGQISVVVDRSIVPPAILRRMASYFLLSTVKNLLFGLALVGLVYAALARHIIHIAEATAKWRPGKGAIALREPPEFLRDTEIEVLGARIAQMSGTAESVIETLESTSRQVQKNNTELNHRSALLSEAVKARTQELNAANLALKRQADFDALTGLTNRGAFDRQAIRIVKDASATGASVALLMIDVDQFKPYNDHYGHQAGDRCLRRIAAALGGLVENESTLIARYGGEEFICLIHGGGKEEGERLAENIHKAIADLALPHDRSSVSDVVTASIGLTWEVCDASSSLETLLGSADEALYEAKHKGRNRTVFSTQLIRERVRQRRETIRDLLAAVEHREFEPYFQSQVDAVTGAIIGIEALARWCRQDGKVLTPYEFLPTAAENDLVRLIDGIIVEKCGAFLRDAQEKGVIVPRLSINLSEDHLRDDKLLDRLRALREGVDTPLAVELLETTALDQPSPQMAWTFDMIREMGFEIEIDDFGTGRASIVSLMTLRPSRLKIARELVMAAPDSDRNKRLLACVLEIGGTLGIDIVAEGVETEAHRDLLLELGCQNHQGFLYARPAPAAAQLEAIRKNPRAIKAS